MICPSCKNDFDPKTRNQKFCSPRCRNNFAQKSWQDINKKLCPICRTEMIRSSSKTCRYCHRPFKVDRSTTIGQYRKLASVSGKHPSWKNAHIRQFAREWNKNLLASPCQKCGYNLHVELAHIRAISDFKDDETIGEVNSKNNLLVLCRNCHWEFDNGIFDISLIKSK
jgi:hypothetical protein